VEFAEVVRRRRMVRNYDPDRPVPPELIDKLLEYAIRAPSAGFSQGWGFLVLTSAVDREAYWQATTGPDDEDSWLRGLRSAPALIIVHGNKEIYLDRYAQPDKGWTDRDETHWSAPYWDIDAGFASMMMLLGAVDEGLSCCFFGVPSEHVDTYQRAFGVPSAYRPIGVISVGYPRPDQRSPSLKRGRRQVAEVAHWGRWGGDA
jgi:nitroreductase